MLSAFVLRQQGLVRIEGPLDEELLREALWFDLREPTQEEEHVVERALGIDVPTREEMREIESSNRLYEEEGALFLTATIVTKLDTDLPESTQVTFILARGKLVTNRYTDPLPFRRFISYTENHPGTCQSAVGILASLLETIVNRIADVLERVGADLDAISAEVFSMPREWRRSRDFRVVLSRVGQSGELVSKTRESLVSLGRLLTFVQQSSGTLTPEARSKFRTVSRDVMAMTDHASFLGDKVAFSLDATLGMLTIDQNNILKIFSMVTVFMLPPSVVGAFFGMNFEYLPWIHDDWGVSAGVGVMLLSSILPYFYFKRRGWL